MLYILEEETTLKYYNSFFAQYKGIEGIDDTIAKFNAEQFMLISIDDVLYTLYGSYITELGEIDGI